MPLVNLNAPGLIFTSTSTDFTGTTATTAQPIFDLTEDRFTVNSNLSYIFKLSAHIHTTPNSVSHTISIVFGGTSTYTSIGYGALCNPPATEVIGGSSILGWAGVATQTGIAVAAATATHYNILLKGVVRFNAGGTFIPQYKWNNAPTTAGVVLANSFFYLIPMGSDTATQSGQWS